MTDKTTSDLRTLAEQAIAQPMPSPDAKPLLSVDPHAILDLLDERDKYRALWIAVGEALEDAERRVAALEEGLRELVLCVDALENRAIRNGGEFHVWIEERQLTEARDEARALLDPAPSEPYTGPGASAGMDSEAEWKYHTEATDE